MELQRKCTGNTAANKARALSLSYKSADLVP
jgi:hypothetical protein